MERFYGKYRGVVTATIDPLRMGRVQVTVPAVAGTEASWAMPCVPFGALGGGASPLPPPGAPIWVEFEGGDPDRPIWTGTFWREGEGPSPPSA